MQSTVNKDEEDVVDDWFLQDDLDLDYLALPEGNGHYEHSDIGGDANGLAETTHEQDDPGNNCTNQKGIDYPSDIWYILSDYISPKQVGCFAAVCKDAYMVTTTVGFWKKLYHRYYTDKENMPLELQPFSMSRTLAIRALVIRALYLMYEPYIARIRSVSPFGEGMYSPDCLINQTCMYTWSWGQVGRHYYHFFKFCEAEKGSHLMNGFNNDVVFNSHADECVLKVLCQNFQHLPSDKIMGLQLINVSVSVSTNFRYHRLKLQFIGEQHRGHYRETDLLTILLDPVILIRVLHWWHPQFQECLNQNATYGTPSTVSAASAIWEGRV